MGKVGRPTKQPPRATLRDTRASWQKAQGAVCGCRGSDDLCPCQNAPEPWKYGIYPEPTAWLIEMLHNDAPIPRYWNPAPNKGWVWDVNKAIRFCRQQDAEDYLANPSLIQGKAVEHKWLDRAEVSQNVTFDGAPPLNPSDPKTAATTSEMSGGGG